MTGLRRVSPRATLPSRTRQSHAAHASSQRPLVAFTGGGLFFYWQLGATLALQKRVNLQACDLSGASAGALSAVLTRCEVDMLRSVDVAYRLSVDAGVYDSLSGLAFVWGGLIRSWLDELLPEDAHVRCTGSVELFTLALRLPPRHLGVRSFDSRADLLSACAASIHIPLFLDGRLTARFRGQRCVDSYLIAPRDLVDTRKAARLAGAEPGLSLLIDHNDDPTVAARRRAGDLLALVSRDGLDGMVAQGRAFMEGELASGRLDALMRAAPLDVS